MIYKLILPDNTELDYNSGCNCIGCNFYFSKLGNNFIFNGKMYQIVEISEDKQTLYVEKENWS